MTFVMTGGNVKEIVSTNLFKEYIPYKNLSNTNTQKLHHHVFHLINIFVSCVTAFVSVILFRFIE